MKQTYNSDYYKEKLKKLNGKDCVKFALFCAKTVNSNSIESNRCIELVEKWLVDDKSVSKEELCDAAYAGTSNTDWSAIYAAYSANAAIHDKIFDNPYPEFNSAYAAFNAAYAAIYAIESDPTKTEVFNNYLEGLLNSTTTYDFNYYKEKLKRLNIKDCVNLALFCAKMVNPNTKKTNHCIELVEKWLKDKKTVRLQELYDAADHVLYTIQATNAHYSVANACYTVAVVEKQKFSLADPIYAILYAIKADPSKTEIINNYLEELLNPKLITEEPTKDTSIMNQTYNYEYYKEKLNKLDKKDCVKFALFCAKIVNNNTKESNRCIDLVEKWLINENSVTSQELFDTYFIPTGTGSVSLVPIYAAYAAYAAYCVSSLLFHDIYVYVAYAASIAIKADSSKTEEINNYLEELMNPKVTYDFNYYEEKLKKLNSKDCIEFALFCAKLVNNNSKECNHCIALMEKWLKDEESVNKEEIRTAALAVYTSNVVWSIYSAAYAICSFSPLYDAAYAAVYAVKSYPTKTEVINNYLEELLNSKPVTQNVTMEDYRNQMKLDNVKKLTKEILILIEANPEELVKLLNYDKINEKMKVLVSNINCLNTIQTDV